MAVGNKTTSLEQEIGQRIMILRGGETQEELAAAIGVSREIIQHWERGTRHIKADHLCALAKHFGKSVDYLVGLVGEDNSTNMEEKNRFKLARTTYNHHGSESVKTVSEATGITKSLIDDLESGIPKTKTLKKRGVSYVTVAKLAKYYGVSADYLVGLSDFPRIDDKARAAYEYTGLSNDAVSRLHDLSQYDKRDTRAYIDLLSLILSDEDLEYLLGLLEGYFAEGNGVTADLAMSRASINPKDLAIFTASNAIRLMLDRIAPEFIKRYNIEGAVVVGVLE